MYYYKIVDGQLTSSKTKTDGFKPLVSIAFNGKIPEGKKLIVEFYETKDNVVSEQKLADKTAQEKIWDLEAQQTPRLMREAALKETYAVDKLKQIDLEIENLRKEI